MKQQNVDSLTMESKLGFEFPFTDNIASTSIYEYLGFKYLL